MTPTHEALSREKRTKRPCENPSKDLSYGPSLSTAGRRTNACGPAVRGAGSQPQRPAFRLSYIAQ
jgi:hypothetical protein